MPSSDLRGKTRQEFEDTCEAVFADYGASAYIKWAVEYFYPVEYAILMDVHEKIQGGYGKYQGTWIPLESGEQLARRNNIYDRIRLIFEYTPGGESPPPAPRHTSKPKAPRKPAVPKWNSTYPSLVS